MSYLVKDVFVTLQGEGLNAGRKAVFVRFAGCNLWSGRAQDRDAGKGACAKWCDTDFFKGKKYEAHELEEAMREAWGKDSGYKFCVLTGGEPALQVDNALVEQLIHQDWEIAAETNGSVHNPDLIGYADHICVSPKKGAEVVDAYLRAAAEIKVVLPGVLGPEGDWTEAELLHFAEYGNPALFVQPLDPSLSSEVEDTLLHPKTVLQTYKVPRTKYEEHVKRCIDWVMKHSNWRLSLQGHKTIGLK